MTIPTITTITESDAGAPVSDLDIKKSRVAARVIVFNADGKFAMYRPGPTRPYRLPGGGVEKMETYAAAATRETFEEIGAKIILDPEPIAQIIELKNAKRIKRANIYFTGKFVSFISRRHGRMLRQKYMPGVIKPDWFTIDEAIKALTDIPAPKKYKDKFVRIRELKFLEYMRDVAQTRIFPSGGGVAGTAGVGNGSK